MQDSSMLRKELSKIDIDPGYFCKFVKDQFVRKFIKEHECRNILDVGADTCYMAKLLHYDEYKFQYTGIDKTESCNQDYLEKKDYFYSIGNHNLIDYMKTLEKYDCILLLDVIEHMTDKVEGLELITEAVNHLKKNTHLIISTPNSLDGVLNWPKYHEFEFNYDEIRQRCCSLELHELEFFGWSYNDSIDVNTRILPHQVAKVLYATHHPETSRDVLFVYKKHI